MPTVQNHNELIYVVRTGCERSIAQHAGMEWPEGLVKVNYDNGMLYITINSITGLIIDGARKGIDKSLEDEFSICEGDFTILSTTYNNGSHVYKVSLPRYIKEYLITGNW